MLGRDLPWIAMEAYVVDCTNMESVIDADGRIAQTKMRRSTYSIDRKR
jgi:hypothetical protein